MKKFSVSDFGVKMDNLNTEEKTFMEKMLGVICEVVNKALDGVSSPEEIAEQFKNINEALNQKSGEFEQVAKDNEALVEQVKNLSETIEKLKNRGLTMSTINKFDEKVNEMLDSEKFQNFAKGVGVKSGVFEGFSLKEMSLTNNYDGDYLLTQQQSRVENPYKNKPLHTRDIVTVLEGDAEHTELVFTQVKSIDRNARFVTENGTLPESMCEFEEKRESVRRVGTHVIISKRMLKSRAYVRSFILNMLPEAVRMAEDWQMIFGDGSGENLLGIVNHDGVKSVENIISTSVVSVAAGDVDSIKGANSGKDTIVEFKKAFPAIVDGMSIKFTGAAVNTALNSAHSVVKVSDHAVLLEGVAYVGEETAIATMTAVVNMAGFKSVTDPNGEDVVKAAFSAMTYAQYSPNAIYLNPMDVFAMETEKDTTGRALNYVQNINGRKYIAGRAVVEYNGIPYGKYLLGDFTNGAALVDYTSLDLEFADDVSTKLKNQVALIAQEEVIFPVYNPWSFAYGSLSALKTAITKA